MDIEAVTQDLFCKVGFNSDSHSHEEMKMAANPAADKKSHTKLLKSYIRRLQAFKVVMDVEARERANKTIAHLHVQLAELKAG